jgi:hypothetical protein
MHKSGNFFIALAALTILVGIWAYRSQRPKPPAGQSPDMHAATSLTNRAHHFSHRLSTADSETFDDADKIGLLKIPREKVEEYLRKHNRDMASLLAAFHALQDTNYLNEAATNFPNDPRLQWTILARNAFPEDRRKWLDSFKTSSPSNSLANYLSAQDYFKNNQPDAAMKELLAASGKSQFKDYSMDTILDGEDLGRFSGSSPMDTHIASMAGMAGDILPELSNFKGIATGIRDMQQQYVNSGDMASVQNLAQAGLSLTDRLTGGDSGKFIINQLVGMACEAVVLDSLDKNTAYDFLGGETPTQRLAELKQQKASIKELIQNQSPLLMSGNEDQTAGYWERTKIYGELEAMRWLQQQTAATPNTGN